jgi:hypothetical protein
VKSKLLVVLVVSVQCQHRDQRAVISNVERASNNSRIKSYGEMMVLMALGATPSSEATPFCINCEGGVSSLHRSSTWLAILVQIERARQRQARKQESKRELPLSAQYSGFDRSRPAEVHREHGAYGQHRTR